MLWRPGLRRAREHLGLHLSRQGHADDGQGANDGQGAPAGATKRWLKDHARGGEQNAWHAAEAPCVRHVCAPPYIIYIYIYIVHPTH